MAIYQLSDQVVEIAPWPRPVTRGVKPP